MGQDVQPSCSEQVVHAQPSTKAAIYHRPQTPWHPLSHREPGSFPQKSHCAPPSLFLHFPGELGLAGGHRASSGLEVKMPLSGIPHVGLKVGETEDTHVGKASCRIQQTGWERTGPLHEPPPTAQFAEKGPEAESGGACPGPHHQEGEKPQLEP